MSDEYYGLKKDDTLYLQHYGRKGMKWHKHIFGDKNRSSYGMFSGRNAIKRQNKAQNAYGLHKSENPTYTSARTSSTRTFIKNQFTDANRNRFTQKMNNIKFKGSRVRKVKRFISSQINKRLPKDHSKTGAAVKNAVYKINTKPLNRY